MTETTNTFYNTARPSLWTISSYLGLQKVVMLWVQNMLCCADQGLPVAELIGPEYQSSNTKLIRRAARLRRS